MPDIAPNWLVPVLPMYNIWSWPIALALFFTGMGAMAVFISLYFDLKRRFVELARLGTVVGALSVLVATILFLSDLGHPERAYLLFTLGVFSRLGASWMARAIVLLTLIIVGGLSYWWAVQRPVAQPHSRAAAETAAAGGVGGGATFFAVVVMILALLGTAYTGFLLGSATGHPFWNDSLVIVFLASGSSTGAVLLMLLNRFTSEHAPRAEALRTLGAVDFWFLVAEAASLLIFLLLAGTNPANGPALHSLLGGSLALLFWVGVVTVGIALPLLLEISLEKIHDAAKLASTVAVIAVMVLLGGVVLRYSIFAAAYSPIPIAPFQHIQVDVPVGYQRG